MLCCMQGHKRWVVMTASARTQSPYSDFWINGRQPEIKSERKATPGQISLSGGLSRCGTKQYTPAEVAEVMCYDRELNFEERAAVETELAYKYGIQDDVKIQPPERPGMQAEYFRTEVTCKMPQLGKIKPVLVRTEMELNHGTDEPDGVP